MSRFRRRCVVSHAVCAGAVAVPVASTQAQTLACAAPDDDSSDDEEGGSLELAVTFVAASDKRKKTTGRAPAARARRKLT